MNYKLVLRNLGKLILLVGAFMATSLVWAVLDYRDDPETSGRVIGGFVASIFICGLWGAAAWWIGRGARGDLFRKEAMAVVGLSWFIFGFLGALPFILTGSLRAEFAHSWDIVAAAIFESISGFTTTGASVLNDIEAMPRAILFWRSLTHWLGGMGVVVLFVAILGGTGSAGKFLVTSETTGPVSEVVRPRIREAAMLLWQIYLGISAAECVLLCAQGMNLFDSLCHTFGTLATGGYSTLNGSIGQYKNLGFEITIIFFMVLAGMNFNVHAACLQRRWNSVWRNRELRVYLLLLLGATLIIMTDLVVSRADDYSWTRALRSAGFQTVSIMTTTGFTTDDFNTWPALSKWLLLILMFIGGSAGSTAGGIKVIRIIIFFKVAFQEVEKTFRPHVVRPLRVNQQALDDDVRRNVAIYFGHVVLIFFTATLLLIVIQHEHPLASTGEIDMVSSLTAVAATLNNIGPGLELVGPTVNYHHFNAVSKLFLSLLMIIGRLEVMVVLCLFSPAFWRRY